MSEAEAALQIRSSADPAGRVVILHGEVDLRSSPRLRGALLELLEDRPARLIIDLVGVTYMDSSGVGTLVEIKRRVEQAGGKLVLIGMQQRVRSVFEITRLDRFFTIAASADEARRV